MPAPAAQDDPLRRLPPGTKAELRSALLAGRRALPTGTRTNANTALLSVLAEFVRWRNPRVLAAYAPIKLEPGGPELPATLARAANRPYRPGGRPTDSDRGGGVPDDADGADGTRGAGGAPAVEPATSTLLLPVLRADYDLDWAAYEGPAALLEAARGLREPTGPRLGVNALATADLVLVPALAVDQYGVRLGRGAGSYDRALSRVGPDALVVALLFDDELVDELPVESHDRRVDAVITPSRGVRQLS